MLGIMSLINVLAGQIDLLWIMADMVALTYSWQLILKSQSKIYPINLILIRIIYLFIIY